VKRIPFLVRSGRQARPPRRVRRLRNSLAPLWKVLPQLNLTRIKEEPHPFFTVLRGLLDRYPVITLGQLLEEAGEQVWGLTVLLLAMLTFIPGVANLLSLATLLVGLRMMGGESRPWLPAALRRRELHRGRIKNLLAQVEARLAWLASRRGPRRAPSQRFLGFLVAWAAFLAALPIPLPFANILPAVALILFGVALLEEWPTLAWLGAGLNLGATAYFALSLRQILIMFTEMTRWVMQLLRPGWF